MNILLGRRFWIDLASIALVALVAGTPIVMSALMDRGHEIPKLALAQPLAFLAFGSILLAGNWWKTVSGQVFAFPALACMAAFLVLAAISSVTSDLPAVAFLGSYYRREGLLVWISYVFVFASLMGLGRSLEWRIKLLDVMLLTSIVPCSYALLQRVDLDFYHVVKREVDRPMGTLGNPLFLASYLGMLLPLSVVRAWISSPRTVEKGLWMLLGLVQGITLLLTQSRAPILAVFAVSIGLLCMIGGHLRARRMFIAAATVLSLIVATVVVINVFKSVGKVAQETPLISRLVYTPDRNASDQTQKASGSAATRLSVLEAGVETFVAAPLLRQLIGFAPDSAYVHYFSHMPDAAMQTEGYWQSNTFDRLHADTLDIVLNFGVLGWLVYCFFFCMVFHVAAMALFPKLRVVGPWLSFLIVVVTAMLGAALAVSAGIPYAAVPAFGFGVGIGWLLLFIFLAWRSLRAGEPLAAGDAIVRWRLLAGLTSALLVFWIDAQVNIPVPTTRYLSFAIAALVLGLSTSLIKNEDAGHCSRPALVENIVWWGVAFALVATCASLFPSVHFDGDLAAKETERWWVSGVPVTLMLVLGAVHNYSSKKQTGANGLIGSPWLLVVVGLPALYAIAQWLLAARVGPEFEYRLVARLSATAGLVHVFVASLCLAYAYRANRLQAGEGGGEIASGARQIGAIAVLALALLTAGFAWRAIEADVGSSFAGWASEKQPEVSDRVLREAISDMPYERQYQRQRILSLLGRALAEINQHGAAPEHLSRITGNLNDAEQQARESIRQFPNDPWIILALANALQIRALPILRAHAPVVGRDAALEADELFARAYEIFPNQPLLLRNWAQLRFHEGDNWGAYRLLDRMESIIPNEVEPYQERINMAKQLGDSSTISDTIERARKGLDRSRLDKLLAVAPIQQ